MNKHDDHDYDFDEQRKDDAFFLGDDEVDDDDDDDDDEDSIFLLSQDDIHEEISVDEEDLPDVYNEEAVVSDSQIVEEVDDSVDVFRGHRGELYTVACSPTDPTVVATGGGDEKGFLWNIGQRDLPFELQGHTDSVTALAFSADGQLLASGSYDGRVQIWDTSSRHHRCTLKTPGGGIEWVRWHPRGNLVLAGSEDCSVFMWNAENGAGPCMFPGHGRNMICGDFTPDGKTICTADDDATLRIWNPRSGEPIHVVRCNEKHTEGPTCLAISSDSTCALTGRGDGSMHVVNIVTGKVVSSLPAHSASIECIEFSPSSTWAASGGLDWKLIIWDMKHLSPRSICYHEGGVTCLTWVGASSRYVASGCVNGNIYLWDSLSGVCVKTFRAHSGSIQSLAVSATGDFLVSVSLDSHARVFKISQFIK